jgi:RimJ/RimL family protein N-acetyltransferase
MLLLICSARLLTWIGFLAMIVDCGRHSSFDFAQGTCEIDNIVRGKACAPKGIMWAAVKTLLDWAYAELQPREVQLRTLHDNTRALVLYHRLGFLPFALYPLKRIEGNDFVEWISGEPQEHIDRFMVAMRYVRR